MSLGDLFTLQGTLFAMILVGMFLRKRGIIDESGKKCLTDLCVNVIIPCSIVKSCLVAVYIGLFLMFTQIPLPGVVEKAVRSIGGCNSAITMFLVGTILAEVKLRDLVDGTALVYSVLRLGILPLIAWGVSLAVGMEPVATGVAVLMTGMPAGATAAIFAARYNSDAPFAARCVVLSTLFSMLTIPLWCWVVG